MPIRVVVLWHMHQPFYKDLVTGEYRLPWVRLHGLKDYYGMVRLLEEFPSVHQTFNLVPSLIAQLEDYVSGAARDPFLQAAATPARELSPEQRRFALAYLFQANATHMIGRYPRYAELYERFRSAGADPERAEPLFQEQDFTDLQVLSQLVWFDEYFLAEPEIAALVKRGRHYPGEARDFVVGVQRELLARALPAYRAAAERGSIEISTSPFYHPILPLLCDTEAGAVAAPGLPLPQRRFRHPEDAREQLQRGLDLQQRVFGLRPRGVWPSEGSVSAEVLAIAHELGVEWMATDEGVLGRSLGTGLARGNDGRLNPQAAAQLYTVHRYEHGATRMHLLFRDHALSDLIGFVYSGMPAAQAAQHLIQRIKYSTESLVKAKHDAVVPIILDGENAWECYPRSGRDFLRYFYDGLARERDLEAVTVSEAIARQREPRKLGALVPGSWINANFNVWIGAPEDNRSWDYLSEARDFCTQSSAQASPEARALAFEELLIAEGSDWNWWYGPEHHSANDRDFDELYRKHLSNIYHALGGTPPESLAQPIAAAAARPYFVRQTAYVHPDLERPPRYFDWMGAAMYVADRSTSAMHGRQFLLDSLQAGIDEQFLYLRLEFVGGKLPAQARARGLEAVVTVEHLASGSVPPSRWLRLTVHVEKGAIAGVALKQGAGPASAEGRRGAAAAKLPAQEAPRELRCRARNDLQMRIPLALLDTRWGGKLRLRVSLWQAGLPLDALPVEGWVGIDLLSERELAALYY